jgi:hypothetical protein
MHHEHGAGHATRDNVVRKAPAFEKVTIAACFFGSRLERRPQTGQVRIKSSESSRRCTQSKPHVFS